MANTGKAFSIKGTAIVNGSELRSGDTIKEGDIIKTGANSSVKIIMKDRTVLDISENTRFEITKYSYNREEPAKNKSSFRLLKGAFRYISGLIAKNRPQNIQISVGTATIGVRGSFDTISFDGTTISVDTSISTAIITLANGETITITSDSTGTFNVSTGQSSVKPNTTTDPVSQAAIDIAANPDDPAAIAQALSNLSDADAIVAIAALINNAGHLGVDDSALLSSAIGNAAAAIPGLAAALAYVGSALSPDNSQAIVDAITKAAPDQADAIQAAGGSGTNLADPPSSTGTDTGTGAGAGAGAGSGSGGGGGGGGTAVSDVP